MSANASTDAASFAETARLIAGENPPQWLVEHLRRWSSSVFLDGNVHARQIGKAEARQRLGKLGAAIGLIDSEIQDSVIAALLLAEKFGPMPITTSMDGALREIGRRAEQASSALNLLDTGLDERLEMLSDAAMLAARELQDTAISEFLKAEQIDPSPENMPIGTALIEAKRQAESALFSNYLATTAGKTKAGPGRALPSTASSPRTFCAAVILEAWAHFHDRNYPGAANPHVAVAAEEYWRMCGGLTNPWSDRDNKTKTLGAWRPYFKQATEPSSAEIRQELRRHMFESSASDR